MNKNICILCESKGCTSQESSYEPIHVKCSCGIELKVFEEIYGLQDEIFRKVSNLIYERHLNKQNVDDEIDVYYYDEHEATEQTNPKHINVFPLLATYPDKIVERMNRSLVNLSYMHPTYGSLFFAEPLDVKALFCYSDDDFTEFLGMAKFMIELGFLTETNHDSKVFTITAKGWQKIEELKIKAVEVKQAFVAMSFGDETQYIREAFKKAISSCNYSPVFIDEKQHNNQIVPEIFYEIGRSKFIVVDVTFPNNGAYYEAGFAQGMGKQVIVCCNKETFDGNSKVAGKPHFDISQKSMVLWENEQDLLDRLIKRIQSTIF
ncbi:MAG: hypothetical protein AB9921_00640 [Erysipelotrichaceae bacterium]